jgi:peptidoglycan/LPS O-acetylase OafA/YrhL
VLWAPLLILVSARAHARLLAVVLTACVGVTLYGEARGWDGMAMSLLPPANFAFMALGGLAVLATPGSLAHRFFGSTALLVVSVLAFGASFAVTRAAYDALGGTPLVVYVTALFFSATLVGWTAQHQSSGVVRLLEIPLLRWLGTISYGFYVYHPLLPGRERIALWLGADWLHRVPWSLWILLELAASLVVSHVSWKYFERRFLALKKSAAKPVAAPVTE